MVAERFLRHMSPLGPMLGRIRDFLKPTGYFILNEFVGMSRFQLADEQLDAVNGLLARLPEKYRGRWKSGTVKRAAYRPGRLATCFAAEDELLRSGSLGNDCLVGSCRKSPPIDAPAVSPG